MARYFFHVRNQEFYTRDDTGVDLSGLVVARDHAARALGEILTAELYQGKPDPVLEIQVEDDVDTRLLTLHVQATVEPPVRPPTP